MPVWGYWLAQPEALCARGRAWLSVRCEGHTTHVSIPRGPTSGKAQQAEALNTAPISLKGTGNLAFSPKLLSSLKLPWMCLVELLLCVLGSLAEGSPY